MPIYRCALFMFNRNDIDGVALKQMLEEQDQSSLKELIPKIGPRLKILRVIEQKYQKPTSKQVDNAREESVHCVFKGQLKLGMVDGQRNMEKVDEMVCGMGKNIIKDMKQF